MKWKLIFIYSFALQSSSEHSSSLWQMPIFLYYTPHVVYIVISVHVLFWCNLKLYFTSILQSNFIYLYSHGPYFSSTHCNWYQHYFSHFNFFILLTLKAYCTQHLCKYEYQEIGWELPLSHKCYIKCLCT